MDDKEFLRARKILGKTQKQLAELLGTSIKAVHSYEQGWRTVPAHVAAMSSNSTSPRATSIRV